jgi:hypothetical protein
VPIEMRTLRPSPDPALTPEEFEWARLVDDSRRAAQRYGAEVVRWPLYLLPGSYHDIAEAHHALVRHLLFEMDWPESVQRPSHQLEADRLLREALGGRQSARSIAQHDVGHLAEPPVAPGSPAGPSARRPTREEIEGMRDRLRAAGKPSGYESLARELMTSVPTIRRRLGLIR